MGAIRKITIDGETLYVKGLASAGSGYSNDSLMDRVISGDTVQSALKPILNLSKMVTSELRKLRPDETELTIQLSIGVEGDKLFFALVDASAEAQVAIKYVWKKNDGDTSD